MTEATSKVGKYKTVKQSAEFIKLKLESSTGAQSVASMLSAKAKAGEWEFLTALMEYMLYKSRYGSMSEEQEFIKTLKVFGEILKRYIEKAKVQ